MTTDTGTESARRPKVALVSARAARDLDEDLPPLAAALHGAGIEAVVAEWDDAQIDWTVFELALLRSTWDYAERLEEFLLWNERVARLTRLLNPAALVRWNTDKHYLADLAAAGVPIVPSTFLEPGMEAAAGITAFLANDTAPEFVVKPAVGAGSRDAQRHLRGDRSGAIEHAARLLRQQRAVLLQPYLESVDERGETALIYFEGRFSHAICKGSLLKSGAASTAGLFAPERITPRQAAPDELAAGASVLAALASAVPAAQAAAPLYARVDLLRDDRGGVRVLEVELTEPSLFFAQAAGSAERFAAAVGRVATARLRART
jgi:O-ureido-D-serine cyclo-ligase